MKLNYTALTTLLASLFLVGCLDSPLFNHADAALSDFAQQDGSCFTKTDLCTAVTWTKLPTDEEKGEFTLRFWKKSEGTVNGPYISPSQDVFVKLWMPSMGHGSSPVTMKPALDQNQAAIPGVFLVSDVYFVMGGDWQILVQLRTNRVVIDQAIIDVKI